MELIKDILIFAIILFFLFCVFRDYTKNNKSKLLSNKPLKIIIPWEIRRGGAVRNYRIYKKTYDSAQLGHFIKGRKVKFWKQVYYADDAAGDEFIPIFYKKKKFSGNRR